MTKTTKYILAIIFAVVAILIIGFLVWQDKRPTPEVVQTTPTPAVTENPKPTLTPSASPDISKDWKEYINNELGFIMRIPEKVFLGNDLVSVKIIEDNKNNVVYIGPGIDSSTKENGWAVTVKQVKNDTELEAFLQERFGLGCKLGKREYLYGPDNSAVYNIELAAGEEGINTNCRLSKVLYNTGLKKVMAIPKGQECGFSATNIDNYGAVCYDNLMISSFRFK